MISHAPANYVCPICLGVKGVESTDTMIRRSDVVYRDDQVMIFIASFFIGNNSGHLIVTPIEHFENIYDLPDGVGAHIFMLARKMSVVMRQAYDCAGVTTLQNNEPAAGQHAFHYHLHLFPRYQNDNIYQHMTSKRATTVEERLPFAAKIRTAIENKLNLDKT